MLIKAGFVLSVIIDTHFAFVLAFPFLHALVLKSRASLAPTSLAMAFALSSASAIIPPAAGTPSPSSSRYPHPVEALWRRGRSLT